LSEELKQKQIEDLMYQYINNINKEERVKVLNSLKNYGEEGIDAISELIKVTGSDELIVYGLGIIKQFKGI
jgi:hypothetical protein